MTRSAMAMGVLVSVLSSGAFADGGNWTMFNHDIRGTRHNKDERKLSLDNVHRLHPLWTINTAGAITGTAVVADERVYIGDWSGTFQKLRARDGHQVWSTQVNGPISASAMVQDDRVIFGDQAGFIYGLDRDTGAIRWQLRPNDHPQAAIFGSAVPVRRNFVMGISSNEEIASADPAYPCCNFRGSIVMVDSSNGHLLWQTFFISEAESAAGSAGATVFDTPTYDEELDLIFFGTSNGYSEPATSRSDSFFALDPHDGHIVWEHQVNKNDVSNFRIQWHFGIDAGISDSPQIYRLANGRKVIGADSKLGHYWVLDAATGEVLREREIQTSGSLGGTWESAIADGVVYTPGIDWADPFDLVHRAAGGNLTAFTGDARHILWQLHTPGYINQGAVAVANSVVYSTACDPGTGTRLEDDAGKLLAVNTATGKVLADVPFEHCTSSGVSVADGRVYVGTGNLFQFDIIPPGTFTALGL